MSLFLIVLAIVLIGDLRKRCPLGSPVSSSLPENWTWLGYAVACCKAGVAPWRSIYASHSVLGPIDMIFGIELRRRLGLDIAKVWCCVSKGRRVTMTL